VILLGPQGCGREGRAVPEIELFAAATSPFSQRVRMALLEKEVAYWHTEIDLANKPEWFLVISPTGQVPVIRHEDRFVADSAVILEYLEEVYPSPALRPRSPGLRALTRFWTKFADERLYPAMLRLLLADEERRSAAAFKLCDLMVFIDAEGFAKNGSGPYWLGQELTLLDLAYYPLLERLPALPGMEAGLPELSLRLRCWMETMSKRPSVQATQISLETHRRAFGARLRPQRRRPDNVEYFPSATIANGYSR
jgi:glutathione S-transferase